MTDILPHGFIQDIIVKNLIVTAQSILAHGFIQDMNVNILIVTAQNDKSILPQRWFYSGTVVGVAVGVFVVGATLVGHAVGVLVGS